MSQMPWQECDHLSTARTLIHIARQLAVSASTPVTLPPVADSCDFCYLSVVVAPVLLDHATLSGVVHVVVARVSARRDQNRLVVG